MSLLCCLGLSPTGVGHFFFPPLSGHAKREVVVFQKHLPELIEPCGQTDAVACLKHKACGQDLSYLSSLSSADRIMKTSGMHTNAVAMFNDTPDDHKRPPRRCLGDAFGAYHIMRASCLCCSNSLPLLSGNLSIHLLCLRADRILQHSAWSCVCTCTHLLASRTESKNIVGSPEDTFQKPF